MLAGNQRRTSDVVSLTELSTSIKQQGTSMTCSRFIRFQVDVLIVMEASTSIKQQATREGQHASSLSAATYHKYCTGAKVTAVSYHCSNAIDRSLLSRRIKDL